MSSPWNWESVLHGFWVMSVCESSHVERDQTGGGNGIRSTHSYMTIDTASLRIDSPKMTEYSFGSTLYVLKMARMVTGSVAERVEPKMRHSRSVNLRPSSPRNDQM